jgi:hypothetical protein
MGTREPKPRGKIPQSNKPMSAGAEAVFPEPPKKYGGILIISSELVLQQLQPFLNPVCFSEKTPTQHQ